MGPLIKIFDTVEELSDYFAAQLALRVRATPEGRTFSWVLSGGTTPKLVFRRIASKFRNAIDWNKVKVFWGDERCVGSEADESNFKMARENLLDFVPISPDSIFRIRGEDDPASEASRYAEVLELHADLQYGIPRPDFVMLGLGEDGHTASIFPGNLQLFNSDRLFEVTEHPVTKQKRITATGKLINHSKTVIILVTGEAKASVAARVIGQRDGYDQLPATFVQPENGELLWLLDQKAAFKLKQNV
jgi:6-phosphogluconolactonase